MLSDPEFDLLCSEQVDDASSRRSPRGDREQIVDKLTRDGESPSLVH